LCKVKVLANTKEKKKVSYFQFNSIQISFFFELERPEQISEGDDRSCLAKWRWKSGTDCLKEHLDNVTARYWAIKRSLVILHILLPFDILKAKKDLFASSWSLVG